MTDQCAIWAMVIYKRERDLMKNTEEKEGQSRPER